MDFIIQGFNNINSSEPSGWAMALVGWMIVFAGLSLLALAISQIHKLLIVWDERKTYAQRLKKLFEKPKVTKENNIPELDFSKGIEESSRQFKMLVDFIGEPFPLPKLLNLSRKSGLQRPYSTINTFIKTGRIVPDGNGLFLWKQDV